jgi:hypothetical protein
MNLWECCEPGCPRKCVGCGGAIGLRAIGWYFVPGWGSNLFCPRHRPDGSTLRTELHGSQDGDDEGKPCSSCQADAEATEIQERLLYPFFGLTSLAAQERGRVG